MKLTYMNFNDIAGDRERKAILISERKNEFVGREEIHVPHHFCCQVSSSLNCTYQPIYQITNDRKKKKVNFQDNHQPVHNINMSHGDKGNSSEN